jgi:uncharacterized YigZ family protein
LKVPCGAASAKILVKRSKFLSEARYFDQPESARSLARELREMNPGCSHVVYAYAVGPAGEANGLTDDGEPKGTAGHPVLRIIQGNDITNVLVTVVRFFGGIKLGTGGLVRAYSDAARMVLRSLPVEKMVRKSRFSVEVPYSLYQITKTIIEENHGTIEEATFEQSVMINGTVPDESADRCVRQIADISGGKVRFFVHSEERNEL